MGIDTHVSGSTRERLALPVGNVLLRLGVTVLLGHTEVDNVNNVGTLGAWSADQEVIGLDVSVDEVLLVDGLDSRQLQNVRLRRHCQRACTYHLLGDHDDRLDRELPVAVIEKILQAGSEEVDDQDVMQTLLAKVVDIRDSGCGMSVRFLVNRNTCVC